MSLEFFKVQTEANSAASEMLNMFSSIIYLRETLTKDNQLIKYMLMINQVIMKRSTKE